MKLGRTYNKSSHADVKTAARFRRRCLRRHMPTNYAN
jgi:hypothetical protein